MPYAYIHTSFRIRKIPKYVRDIFSWRIFDMSDVHVCLHEAMFAVERLVSFLVILCPLGLCLWGPHLDTRATTYTLATAYEGKQLYWLLALGPIACNNEILLMYGIDFWFANNIIPIKEPDHAYPRHLRRAARSVPYKEQC